MRMAGGVGVNPAGSGFTHDLRHAIEHSRARIDGRARIADEQDIGLRVFQQFRDGLRGSIFRIDDAHFLLRESIEAGTKNRTTAYTAATARRSTPTRRTSISFGLTTITPLIRLLRKKSPSRSSTTAPWLRDACRSATPSSPRSISPA